jgi:surface protein
MGGMFYKASAFNQPLNSWDVSSVVNMDWMFNRASSFNQPLNVWNVSNVTNMASMLGNTGLSMTNYDATLTGWKENTNTPNNITLGTVGLKYCVAESARQYLIDTKRWIIIGDSKDCSILGVADNVLTNSLKRYPNPTKRYIK